MQKGQTPVLILVGILIIMAVAGGSFFLGKSATPKLQTQNPVATSQIPQPTLTSSATDYIANWKSYTSKTMGVSFMYPNTYTYSEGQPVTDNEVAIISPLNPNRGKGYSLEDGELKVEITIDTVPAGYTISKQEENSKKHNLDVGEKSPKTERIMVNGIEAIHTKYDDQFGGDHYILIVGSRRVFVHKYPTVTSRDNEFRQILSTFKFQ